jgi:hypothetical protein
MKNHILPIVVALLFVNLQTQAQENEFHLDKTYSIDKSGTIILSSDDADVIVVGSNRNDVRVKIDRVVETKGVSWGDRYFDVIIEEDKGNLRIKDKEWGSQNGFVGYHREEYVILIEAPRSVDLDFNGDDDDYEISEMAGKISVRLDDGDIRIENCSSPKLNFEIDDGNISVHGASGELFARLDDGDINVYNGSLTGIDIRGDDSDFDIETSLADEGEYSFRIEDSSLDLNILGGGGVFTIHHDDAGISADRVFELKEQDEDFRKYHLPGGSAKVEISGDDMRVRLRSSITN